MNDEKKEILETVRMNRAAIICYLAEIIVISLAYLVEVVKQNRTLAYFMLVFVTLWIPAIITVVMQKKEADSKWVRYLVSIGFLIPQSIMMFTANNDLVFTYGILILVVSNVFSDLKYSVITVVLYNLVTIASVAYPAVTTGLSKEQVVTAEIQILLMLICGAFSLLVSSAGMKISAQKLGHLNREKQNVSDLLQQVMQISGEITEGIEQMNGKMSTLGDSVVQTSTAMLEVRTGSTETAEAIQHQLAMTEEIQKRIDEVSGTADVITKNVSQTKQAIELGAVNMKNLEKQVEDSELLSEQASSKLGELVEYTNQMQTIVDLINSVADQTGLLSLNASIEAARAGEQGKGFAVVASEISTLASQTQEATEHIEELISNVVAKLTEVTDAINVFIKGNIEQQEVAKKTFESLSAVGTDADDIADNTMTLHTVVEKLVDANQTIIGTVQNISAVTEEVSSHSDVTYESSEQNIQIVKEVGEIATSLQEKAELLKNK